MTQRLSVDTIYLMVEHTAVVQVLPGESTRAAPTSMLHSLGCVSLYAVSMVSLGFLLTGKIYRFRIARGHWPSKRHYLSFLDTRRLTGN